MPGATGLQNFLRYMGGAVGASLAITLWDDRAKIHRAQLAEHLTRGEPNTEAALGALRAQGFSADQSLAQLDHALDAQARMLSTIDLDHQPPLPANKVDDEWANRFLSNELTPTDGARPQAIPKQQFSVRRIQA